MAMSLPNLMQLEVQLQSSTIKDRVLAMIEIQKGLIPPLEALPLIQLALADDNTQVRGMAVYSLGIQPTPENLSLLIPILTTDPDPNMRAIAAGALGYLEDRRAFEPLRHAFYEDDCWLVQFSAAVALGNLKDPQATGVLLEALDNEHILMQEAAIAALGEIGAVETLPRLLQFVDAADWLVRRRLAEALGNLPSPQSQSALKFLKGDINPLVAESAMLSLKRLLELT
jgi:HEAT repeat protein